MLQRFQAQEHKLDGSFQFSGMALVVDGELFAGKDSLMGIADQLLPKGNGARQITTTLGHERKFAGGARAKFFRQAGVECVRAGGVGEVLFAFAMQEFRKAEEVEGICHGKSPLAGIENRVDLSKKGGEATQVHLIVLHDSREGLAGTATEIVEVKLRDKRRGNVVLAVPAETSSIQNAAFQFDETHGAEAKTPERTRGVKKIEMGGERGNTDGTGHGEAIFEQGPVEGLAVEGDEDGPFG